MEPCPFCRIAAGESDDLVALRTDRVVVVPPPQQRPNNRGHMLVLPCAHVTRLVDAEPALLEALYGVAGRVSMAVRAAFGASGATVFQNDDAPDQVLHHLHVHVVPRRAGDDFRMPALVKDALSHEERRQQADALRRVLR